MYRSKRNTVRGPTAAVVGLSGSTTTAPLPYPLCRSTDVMEAHDTGWPVASGTTSRLTRASSHSLAANAS